MLSYSTQIVICDSVRETIRQILIKSSQFSTKLKVGSVPTTDSILRAVSLLPNMSTEDQLKAFIIKRVLADLRLTESQKDQLNLTIQKQGMQ